jgi:hypothetical protein
MLDPISNISISSNYLYSIPYKSTVPTTSAEISALRRKSRLFHFIIPDAVIFLQGNYVFEDFSWEILISRK